MHKYAEYCDVLGLKEPGSEKQLKDTYRRAIKEWHPDKHLAHPAKYEESLRKIKDINIAYKFLSESLRTRPAGKMKPDQEIR